MLGEKGQSRLTVKDDMLAVNMGSGDVRVFATPAMIAFMEKTAASGFLPYLEDGYTSVGTQVNVAHLTATPVGMKVHFQSEVLEVSDNGKMIALRVQAFDDAGLIGEGTHKRAIVRRIYFEEKALKKSFPQARK